MPRASVDGSVGGSTFSDFARFVARCNVAWWSMRSVSPNLRTVSVSARCAASSPSCTSPRLLCTASLMNACSSLWLAAASVTASAAVATSAPPRSLALLSIMPTPYICAVRGIRSDRRLVERLRPLQLEVVIAAAMEVHETVLDGSLPSLVEVGIVGRRGAVAGLVNLVAGDDVLRPAPDDRHVHSSPPSSANPWISLQVSYLPRPARGRGALVVRGRRFQELRHARKTCACEPRSAPTRDPRASTVARNLLHPSLGTRRAAGDRGKPFHARLARLGAGRHAAHEPRDPLRGSLLGAGRARAAGARGAADVPPEPTRCPPRSTARAARRRRVARHDARGRRYRRRRLCRGGSATQLRHRASDASAEHPHEDPP